MRFKVMVSGVVVLSLMADSAARAETIYSKKETRQIAYKFGACVVKHHAGGASKAVLRNVDSLGIMTRYSALIDRDCLADGSKLAFPGDFYIYALADALVTRELAKAPIPDLSKVPQLERRATPKFADLKRKFGYDIALSTSRDAEIFDPLNDYGECVVRQSPGDAKALLMVEPESAEETNRFEALQPALSACAREGTSLELSKFLLRGTIALNYYRLAQAALHIPVH